MNTKGKKKVSPNNPVPVEFWIVPGIILILILLGAVMTGLFGRLGTLPGEITVQEAHAKAEQGVFMLDVREPYEWNEVHIEGATLIPLATLPDRVNELPKDREIVVVCRSGNRSAEGRDILKRSGFSQVTSMAGGMLDWQAKGYPTVTGP
jgi:rhodanese-related sulfurtransferase